MNALESLIDLSHALQNKLSVLTFCIFVRLAPKPFHIGLQLQG